MFDINKIKQLGAALKLAKRDFTFMTRVRLDDLVEQLFLKIPRYRKLYEGYTKLADEAYPLLKGKYETLEKERKEAQDLEDLRIMIWGEPFRGLGMYGLDDWVEINGDPDFTDKFDINKVSPHLSLFKTGELGSWKKYVDIEERDIPEDRLPTYGPKLVQEINRRNKEDKDVKQALKDLDLTEEQENYILETFRKDEFRAILGLLGLPGDVRYKLQKRIDEIKADRDNRSSGS